MSGTRLQAENIVIQLNTVTGKNFVINGHLLAKDGGYNTYRLEEENPLTGGTSDVSPRLRIGPFLLWLQAFRAGVAIGLETSAEKR